MNAALNNVNLIPASRRARRRREYIRRSLRLCALCFTLVAIMWIACQRNGVAQTRANSATSRMLQELVVGAGARE